MTVESYKDYFRDDETGTEMFRSLPRYHAKKRTGGERQRPVATALTETMVSQGDGSETRLNFQKGSVLLAILHSLFKSRMHLKINKSRSYWSSATPRNTNKDSGVNEQLFNSELTNTHGVRQSNPRLVGAEKGARPGCGGEQGTGCPPRARPAPRGADGVEGSACGCPTPARVARAGAGHNGPAGRADGPRPGCGKGKRNGERAEGEGGMGGPAAAGAGGEARGRGARLPHRRPNKDARRTPAEPCLPGRLGARTGEGSRFAPRNGREAPSWGGGVPGPPHAGKSPLPAAARVTGPARPRQPGGPAPAPQEAAAALESPGSRRRAGTRQRRKLGSENCHNRWCFCW
ncbi:collagen alpha-1(I) chain-like [Panthera leo]|uniref:collagen alpha-1(I) chain-like n=1 Tax=Panthera leo TaxID=9689 RepID=UPI001C6A49A4|nr:collagen alpha-1(I) chain-like [Panthera leo]